MQLSRNQWCFSEQLLLVFRGLSRNESLKIIDKESGVLMRNLIFAIILLPLLSACAGSSQADWRDVLKDVESAVNKQRGGDDNNTKAAGIREALRIGARKSIDKLGKKGGFLNDAGVKIPMPEKLHKVDKLLRKVGQKKLADKFVVTMNHAAEDAVKTTFPIFVDAIKQMTLEDAARIVTGRDDEATRYFRNKKGGQLHSTILPVVKKATESTGVTSNYKKIKKKTRRLSSSLADNMPDIDNYVTEKALDGLFKKIAEQELLIRKDPAARTTELLQQVFGR